MSRKQIAIITIIIILFIISVALLYKWFIMKYTLKNDIISYDYFIKQINIVNPTTRFMNYGLWDKEHDTLSKATNNLINFIYDKADLDQGIRNILDVGCGYGQQDIELIKKVNNGSKITAVDISEKQINWAKKNYNKNNIKFETGDAMKIDEQYIQSSFDNIFSIESAFHYDKRPKFFKNVNYLLKDTGTFIISDLALKKDYNKMGILMSIFIKIFSDFFHIPKQNLISTNEWIKQLSNELKIVKTIDITDKTFKPHYRHFLQIYLKKINVPVFFRNFIVKIFTSIQPFTYTVAICKKKIQSSK